ncbi:HNH endonuclease signature motif containing protein [Ruania albidiflava]|uniref:HNH endonuclease signature motif containing protein n=2 Tax=Ruania albidiflava TaxID=366586 RepID=UPI0003B2E282|nr:HNH endonuclease signature motif containing protein [Ruania albidiflava]
MADSTRSSSLAPDTPVGDLLEADLPTQLATLEALCDAIVSGDIQDERDRHTGPELGSASVRVHQMCARLTAKRYQWIAAEEADGLWAASEFHPRTYASYVAHTHGISYSHARSTVRLARQLRDEIPQFGAALRAGKIGPDQVQAFAATALTSPTRVAALAEEVQVETEEHSTLGTGDAPEGDQGPEGRSADHDLPAAQTQSMETFLLDQARHLRPDQVRRLGRHFAHVADPEADERGYRKAKEREYLELVRTLDGWHLSGFLTEENGRLIRTAMDAVMSPPAPDDERTGEQRRAQALADIAHLVLDQGLLGNRASVRPHLGVLIGAAELDQLLINAHEPDQGTPEPAHSTDASWQTPALADLAGIDWAPRLTEQPPTFDDGTGPVPPALLRRLATCGGIYRVLFSPESEIINHGRERRLFTPAQRRALIARDKGCTWPGCTAPPVICESHHARIHWADGGPTNTANGALLCYHHHALVDTRSISMTRHDHRWIFTRPDGTLINPDHAPPHRTTGEPGGWTLTS